MTEHSPTVPVKRERGTLRRTLNKHPYWVFVIVNLASTGLAVLCCRSKVESREAWPAVIVGAALSSLAAMAGIIYADSSMHSFFLGLAILATFIVDGIAMQRGTVETVSLALSLSRAMLLLALAARLPMTSKIFPLFSTEIILNQYLILAVCCLFLSTFLSGGTLMILQQSSFDDFAVGVPAVLALATLLLCGLYYRNRSHEYGNLLISAQQQGVAVCAALALMWTIQYAIGRNVAGVFLPILLGSVLTTLLCVIFASVGDTWYAVGSGQFQMVSLDTAALLGYVVAPLVVLISIACEKYGQQVSQALTGFVKSSFSDNVPSGVPPPEQTMISGLFLLLGVATMIGIPLVNALCPLGAYLLSRAYMHGQPNTRHIALCLDLKDILDDSLERNEERMERVLKSCSTQRKPVILNFVVTANEMRTYPAMLRKYKASGQAFGICSDTVSGIHDAHEEYMHLFETEPLWYHVGPNGGVSVSPAALTEVSELHMRVAFWSHHIGVTSYDTLIKVDLPNLSVDVAKKNGGDIIYLTDSWNDPDAMATAVESIVQELGAKSDLAFTFSPLPLVAKEDPPMEL